MFGWQGKALRVNLSNGGIKEEPIAEELLQRCLGGDVLAKEIAKLEDVSSHQNKMIIACGALTGTGVPAAALAYVATYDSEQEKIVTAPILFHFGSELRYCGYDVLIVEGQAANWSYILVRDGQVSIEPFPKTNTSTAETEKIIRSPFSKWYGNEIRILSIGPAGERKSAISALVTDELLLHHTAGIAKVFGEKKLKAIALRGISQIRLAQPAAFQNLITQIIASFIANKGKIFDAVHQFFPKLGLPLFIEIHSSHFDKVACMACPIACLHQKDGQFLPNSTVCFCLSELMGIETVNEALELYTLCTQVGIDPVALSLSVQILKEAHRQQKVNWSLSEDVVVSLKKEIQEVSSLLHRGPWNLAKEFQLEDSLKRDVERIAQVRQRLFEQFKITPNQLQLLNQLGICQTAILVFSYDDITKALEMVTGSPLKREG